MLFYCCMIGVVREKGVAMGLIKYYIGKLNISPRFDQNVEDVLTAAENVLEINHEISNGEKFFYVVPAKVGWRNALILMRMFRSNGIVLMPYKTNNSRYICSGAKQTKNGTKILRVRDRNQKFINDVKQAKENPGHFSETGEMGNPGYFAETVVPDYTQRKQQKIYLVDRLRRVAR